MGLGSWALHCRFLLSPVCLPSYSVPPDFTFPKEGHQMLVRPHHPLHWDKISPDTFTFSDVTGSSHQPQKVNSKEVQKGGGSSEERARVCLLGGGEDSRDIFCIPVQPQCDEGWVKTDVQGPRETKPKALRGPDQACLQQMSSYT